MKPGFKEGSMLKQGERQRLEILRAQMDSERSTFIGHWRDLADHFAPRRARFTLSDANRGEKKNQKIIDSTGTQAANILRAGMMSGITSPARPWFRLGTGDTDLNEFGPVKRWLDDVQRIMLATMGKTNLYNSLSTSYGDLGIFGTAPISVEEDFQGDVFNTQSYPVGSYMLAKDHKGRINVFIRDFRMTVRQLIEKFAVTDGEIDWEVLSTQVKNMWERGQTESWVDVCHAITPNPDYDPEKVESKFKKFKSVYYERGFSTGGQNLTAGLSDKILSEKGFDMFPVLAPRWGVTGEDVYGTQCPGMDSLGDVRQLQLGERRSFEAIEKMMRPPMIASSSMQNKHSSILPGDITYVDMRDGAQSFRPAYEVNFPIKDMEFKQDQARQRIQRAFYADLFLMLANDTRSNITATEIAERKEEKLLALGPVLEQLNFDVLDPLIDLVFDYHVRQNLLPPPPEEIADTPLKVEYVSVMAQAQKLIGISGIERFAGFVQNTAGVDPRVLDKVDTDQLIDVYGDMLSIPASIVRSDDDVEAIRAQKAQAEQAAAAAEQMNQVSQSVKNLGQADVGGDTALTDMLDMVRGI